MAENVEVLNRFKSHPMDNDQINLTNHFRDEFKELALQINEDLLSSREQSLALTKLEEASFYVSAGIARNPK